MSLGWLQPGRPETRLPTGFPLDLAESHGIFRLTMPDNSPAPQFGVAQYGEKPAQSCKFCGLTITGPSYRVGGSPACSACADRARQGSSGQADTVYPRALLLGIVGAALGLAVYAAFTIITNIEIGYISLAVGFIIAKAMLFGSGGLGGRKYQITAVILTYVAVSMAQIPIAAYLSHVPVTAIPLMRLIQIGLTSPFLELQADAFRGAIGLLILFVGMRIAWKMTQGKSQLVEGPF